MALALLALLSCCMSLRLPARQLHAVSRTVLLRSTTSRQMASHSIATTPRGDLFCTRCGQASTANKTFQFSASCAPAAEELAAAHTLECQRLSAAAKMSEAELSAAAKKSEAERYSKRETTFVFAGVMVLGIASSLFFGMRGAEWVDRTVKSFAASARGKASELADARVLPITGVLFGCCLELGKASQRLVGSWLEALLSRLPRWPSV